MAEILLGESINKLSPNEENFIGVDLTSYQRNLPYTEDSYNVDAYLQYFKEKDASDKYRLAFTITPFCTNALFNVITEPVYHEGGEDCKVVLRNGSSGLAFSGYKSSDFINRKNVIRDTGFSHPKIPGGPLVYHCGYDIFNNHYLRKREFTVINSGNTQEYDRTLQMQTFNTIFDKVRDKDGNVVKDKPLYVNRSERVNTAATDMHVYRYDSVQSYSEAVWNGLVENNGWFGFLNPATIPVKNVTFSKTEYSLNKCMNNNKAWEQIDMYPDRSLFSFIPKINKYRGRVEKNWDYCLTYPKESDTTHTLVYGSNGTNGLLCKYIPKGDETIGNIVSTNGAVMGGMTEDSWLTFKTGIKHNLSVGDRVSMSFIGGGSERKTVTAPKVVSLGHFGKDEEHCFSVKVGSIMGEIMGATISEIRIRKFEAGSEAQYYLRKFYPLPLPPSSLNKLAFSQNIYSDQVAQIIFTDDVITSGLTDNLGRPLSEIYLTIVKRNAGWNEWYNRGIFNDSKIEFSHCFGEVTSGLDLPADEEFNGYNVRKIHSVPVTMSNSIGNVAQSPVKLEEDITIENEWFYGDVVEFIASRLEETTIDDVYHRFNTAQRETVSDEYSTFTYDSITSDDYDVPTGTTGVGMFNVKEVQFGGENINILPEGYYYKPHYKVQIREFSEEVQQGEHIRVSYDIEGATATGGNAWDITLARNYYFQSGDTVYWYEFNEDGSVARKVSGTCTFVNDEDFREASLRFNGSADLRNERSVLFRAYPEMPEWAYELNDGTGRFLWREMTSFSDMLPDSELYDEIFTNGAHYQHKNIMFYLKRQDPDGTYGLSYQGTGASFFNPEGMIKDTSYAEYEDFKEGGIC